MNYLKILASMIIACLVLFTGCIHAQYSGKKQSLMTGNLPGMGGVVKQEELRPAAATASKESMPEKITVTPPADNETITREVFSVSSSTMSTEAAAAMSKTAMETTVVKQAKKQPSKTNIPDNKSIIKPLGENDQKAIISGQPLVCSSAAVAQPAAHVAEKTPLLAPSSADIEELQEEEEAQKPAYEKPVKSTEPSVTPAKETAEENEAVEEIKAEVKPQPVIEKSKPMPQVKIETRPDSIQEDRFTKEKSAVTPSQEVKPAKPAAKLTAEERQQAAKIKYKEEEMKKRQKQEEPKHPAKMHTVAAGDTLPLLAEKYYGDKNQWVKIYDANKDKIEKGSLKADQLILIP